MLVVYFNKESARVCRRREVRQADGAYKRFEERLGDLPLDAADLPSGFPELTERERGSLNAKFFDKAQALREKRRRTEDELRSDPMRRILAAREQLQEAAQLSKARAVGKAELKALLELLLSVRCKDTLFLLEAVRQATVAAAAAADDGAFGTRPDDESLRNSAVTVQWNEARDAVVGTDASSLMRALQRRKWAKGG